MNDQVAGFIVVGRVQGVGFRWWTLRLARSLGLRGGVRNLSDGSVEVRARGSDAALRELEGQLRRGPPAARVTDLRRFDPGRIDDLDFEISAGREP